MSFSAALFILAALCLRDAYAFSSGAPLRACTTLTQDHPGVATMECTDCPFSVSLMAINGEETNGTMYRCGERHTLRLKSSGPTFRGLAVQVREATGSTPFSNDAAFVGQFADPPSGGNWKIWDCDAPSATHPNPSDKTLVDMTWDAPDGQSDISVTIWFAITRNFNNVHPQIMGPTLSPDPAFCVPPSSGSGADLY